MSREKHVWTKSAQVAHVWAQRTHTAGRNGTGSIFFEGDTIYSYGHHFPIAQFTRGRGANRNQSAVVLTTCTYSKTTAGHVCDVRRAIPSHTLVFHVPFTRLDESALANLSYPTLRGWFDSYAPRIAELLTRAKRARTYSDSYLRRAQALRDESNAFRAFFALRCAPIPADIDLATAIEKKIQAQRNAQRKSDKERAERERAISELIPAALADWQSANTAYLSSPNPIYTQARQRIISLPLAYLRPNPANPDEIETTKGARFPTTHGRRAYRFLSALRARGEGFQRNGHTIHVGEFQVDSMAQDTGIVRAGCHTLEWSEIARMARVLGWDAPAPAALESSAD